MSATFIHFMDNYINIENIAYIHSGYSSDLGWKIVIQFWDDKSLVYGFDDIIYCREAEKNLIGVLEENGYILQSGGK